ncbi:MAG: YebC/PmpR family DNA-binding transcriptional regulator [Deltaproteobacteria bacterium]|nr:YebC/PmpR family DNA-binding transcriptional regulator [Deltaproteobacteria bacterium]MBI3078565.1 YebC/PmpR family DNA-binding transcriptional regulator [Deltaproteobacteria bacterium]
MSGHSKWAQIKRKKGAEDVRRGKIFTKLIKEITVTARMGGGDPDGNPRLRKAIADAKAQNMPQDNIVRAIKRGTGELEGVAYEEVVYEGYGPGGVAVLVESMTDNKKRTVMEIRSVFTKNGGGLGEAGCVAWMFHKTGVITCAKGAVPEERLLEVALESGAEDVREEEDTFEVIVDPGKLERVRQTFDELRMKYTASEVSMRPQSTIKLQDRKHAEQVLRLMDALDECEDVQHVYANFDIPAELMEEIGG